MRGENVAFEDVYRDTIERDQRDMTRGADPLQIVSDAWVVDATDFKIEKVDGLPTMPLKELVSYCKMLSLDNVLEQLDLLYNLGLKVRYSEVATNV